jgi:hypothetical protein
MGRRDPCLSLVQGRMLIICLDIGEKAKIEVYNHYIYMLKYYIPKKNEGKWSGMSGKAYSSSGMMSATVAEAVACVDQPWETVIGC